MAKRKKVQGEPDYAGGLSEIINSLARLRSLVDASNLPEGEAKQNLITHLALASIAAHSFRLTADDDIIVLDDE
ncbi:MAG: hypothetical protein ACT4OF_13895 [Caulobacteraceae bacterium]